MPITLPSGLLPPVKPLSEEAVLTSGTRVTDFRFDILDREENHLSTLQGVQPGGTLEFTNATSIKGGGTITVTDLSERIDGKPIDWLNIRIRPVCLIEGIDREIPLGIWLASVPSENWSEYGRVWEVELLDKASILDDVWTDPSTGEPDAYSAVSGANVVSLIRALIEETGESAAAIVNNSTTLANNMTWDAGSTRLLIINELLEAAGFFSLWVDYEGQFQVVPYILPADRPPEYVSTGPFERDSGNSVMSPDFSVEKDIYTIPNRFIAFSQGDEETPALRAIAVNTDPDSPFSYISRGRWITEVASDVETTGQSSLDLYAQRRLITATSKTAKLEVSHAFLPQVQINRTLRLSNPPADLNMLVSVQKTSIVLDPLAFCTSTLNEVEVISNG